ncbi:tetratricopeptide repeat protein [Arthrobacter sp. zg-Y1110]|uniref:SEL1-like repeat protein n=1 Tax=Arthrobacter sp. zg-Y1110 TaxID=2886932 RepID=UPI001D1576E5|nr:tetratricopeptide repeat protein [Arthrobacter sp. zg-Y1110]MCC3291254.1 tetratricopeptide repeat protein [Arthrobacter sp. zg-Y1110]UWX83680.1 tetratricopeptide repeat protein [Arthrobacter sp. zg-Y1110]
MSQDVHINFSRDNRRTPDWKGSTLASEWKSRKRGELKWWFPASAVAWGALAIFLGSVGWSPWVVVPLGILGVVGLAIGPFLKEKAKVKDASVTTRLQSMLTKGSGSALAPLADEVPLNTWRVHKSRIEVPYLRRDAEEQFITAVKNAEPVLVLGSSMAGKTRMAAQLIKENFSDTRVFIPDAPDGVSNILNVGDIPRGHVIWLDDLERYLRDPKDLKARWIQELQSNGNILVATMRSTSYESFMPNSEEQSKSGWDTLQCFTKVYLTDETAESVRLANSSGNPELSMGIMNYGLGTYLGGGYLAVERLEAGRSSKPAGRAFVLAAIDWQRAGVTDPIPRGTAENLLYAYLGSTQSRVTSSEITEGLAWATDKAGGGGLFGLVEETDEGLRPFDYLVDFVSSTNTPIPYSLWLAVERCVASGSQLNRAGVIAEASGQLPSAAVLFERAAMQGDQDGMHNYSISLERQDQIVEAMKWDQKAADAGNLQALTGLAVKMLRSGEQTDDALRMLREAADAGDGSAMANLGVVLLEKGKTAEGFEWYRRAADAGSALGMVNYGIQLEHQGDESAAKAWYERAKDRGDASGAAHFQLSMLADKLGDKDEADRLLREAVARRNPTAMGRLGMIMAGQGRHNEAKTLFEGAAQRGGAVGLAMVGRDLADQGKYPQAEQHFKRAIAQGLLGAVTDLDVMYANTGRIEEAKEQYMAAISANDDVALRNYGGLLIHEKKLAEGEETFRRAAAHGSAVGMYFTAEALFAGGKADDQAEALVLLEQAASLGNLDALCESGRRAADEGDLEEARLRLRKAADGGHTYAAECLRLIESHGGEV